MEQASRHIGTAALCFVLTTTAAAACAEPPPLRDVQREVDTKGALAKLMSLAGLEIAVKGKEAIKSVLPQYPLADQTVLVLTMMHDYCKQLDADKNLSGEQKSRLLAEFQRNTFVLVIGPRPISTTSPPDPRRALPAPDKESSNSNQRAKEQVIIRYASTSAPQGSESNENFTNLKVEPTDEWSKIYLNGPPVLITDGNKHFVIVGSRRSRNEAESYMNELKKRHSQYDFALYAPYGSNSNYAIMLASWTSIRRAREALAAARRIDPTSIIWSCRGKDGTTC